MPCHSPLVAYRTRQFNPETGKQQITFNIASGLPHTRFEIPCGQCIGCRVSHARQWALRCQHEAHAYMHNSFITLTYDDKKLIEMEDKLSRNFTLNKIDFPLFMKRLRKHVSPTLVRFYHCAEYGENNSRPHHHLLLFNYDFITDRYIWSSNPYPMYRSDSLDKLWGFGFCLIGDCIPESILYTTKYVTKRVTGDKQNDYYVGRIPPHSTCSRRPGLGADFYSQYSNDFTNFDRFISEQGLTIKTPRYYDTLTERMDPALFENIKQQRRNYHAGGEHTTENPEHWRHLQAHSYRTYQKIVERQNSNRVCI